MFPVLFHIGLGMICQYEKTHLHCAENKTKLLYSGNITSFPLLYQFYYIPQPTCVTTGGLTQKINNTDEKKNQRKTVTKLRMQERQTLKKYGNPECKTTAWKLHVVS
jgi:hypothetical protein